MGYKQHNNPFSRKISSPLKHNVRNAQGQPWRHTHTDKGFTGTYDTGRVISSGNKNFGGKKRDKKVKGLSERESAMILANKIANQYNQGALAGGSFVADDYEKWKSYNRSKDSRSLLSKLTGIDAYTSANDYKFHIDFGKKKKGFSGGKTYNVKQGEWDSKAGAYKNVPTEQVTPEQIYDMMVEGGGMVSIVDGKIVAGNPNQDTYMRTRDFRSGSDLPEGFTVESRPRHKKMVYYNKAGDDITNMVRDGYTNYDRYEIIDNPDFDAEMEAYNTFYDEKSDSPLQSNHEGMDEKSGGPKEGFIYTPGEEVISTRTEEVYGPDGKIIGYNDITDTTITNTGQREIDGGNPTPPNWQDCYENGVFQTGKIVGSGVNAIKCIMDPDPQPTPDSTIETDSYDTTTSETVFRPIEEPEPEETLIPPPTLDLSSPGSIKSRGLEIKFGIPDLDLMGGIREIINGIVFTNRGKCKAGCATNKNS